MANLLVHKVDNVFFDFVDLFLDADKIMRMDRKKRMKDGNPIRSIGDSAKGRGASGIPAFKILLFYEMFLKHAITAYRKTYLRKVVKLFLNFFSEKNHRLAEWLIYRHLQKVLVPFCTTCYNLNREYYLKRGKASQMLDNQGYAKMVLHEYCKVSTEE